MATIKILGTGCARCGHLWMNARRAVENAGRSDTIEKVTDFDQILSYLPAALPALVIDGRVTSAGNVPTPAAILAELQAADRRIHWDAIYRTKADSAVSWYESEPRISWEMIQAASPEKGAVIDVGGGRSRLVDRLLDAGYPRPAVLDVSEQALAETRRRLGDRAGLVRWIEADVLQVEDVGTYDVWHDRAVFHFLTDPEDRRRYLRLLRRSLPVGGRLIVAAFGLDGPERCSGLPTCRYDAKSMSEQLGAEFELVEQRAHRHTTPGGAPQNFFYGAYRRVESE